MMSRPEYLSKRSLAKYLDFKEGAIDQLVRRGLLPPPLVIGGYERWRWCSVDQWLNGMESNPHNQLGSLATLT